jgi:NADH-ubiquinone oxidoreductase chain 5
MSKTYRFFYVFWTQKWNFDQIANEIFVTGVMNFGYKKTFQLIDKGNIEFFGPTGVSSRLQYSSNKLTKIQNGSATTYAFVIILTMLLFILSICLQFLFSKSLLFFDILFLVLYSYVVFFFSQKV